MQQIVINKELHFHTHQAFKTKDQLLVNKVFAMFNDFGAEIILINWIYLIVKLKFNSLKKQKLETWNFITKEENFFRKEETLKLWNQFLIINI